MKKRLFSLVLTLALCLGLTVPVSAKLSDNYEIFSVICDDYVISTTEGSGGSVLSAHDGLRDKAGNIVLPAEYIDLQFIDGADALIARKHMEGRRYADGIIDVHGNTLVPFQYINIDPLSGHKGYLTVEDPSTYLRGLLGPDFSLVVPTKYYTVDVRWPTPVKQEPPPTACGICSAKGRSGAFWTGMAGRFSPASTTVSDI